MFELIYTSAPRGLLQGRSGYTTVALTAGMPPNLILPVENLSGYNFTLRDGQFSPEFNPVSCSCRKVRFGNMVLHVASRIAPCGLDYSGRNNKIAHHLIFETPAEAAALSGGAAEAFLADGNFRTGWNEEPHTLPARRVRAGATLFAPPCRTWETLTGDAGYAAMLARRLTTSGARPFYLACPRTMETATLLMLAAEIASLLTPEQRADFTFTTCFDREQPGEECFLRMLPDFSPALGNLRKFHATELLDLTMPVPPLPEECADPELLTIARFGRKETIELASDPPIPEPIAEPLRLADPEESEPDRPWRRPLPSPIWNRPQRPRPPQNDEPQTSVPRIVAGKIRKTNSPPPAFSRWLPIAGLVLVGIALVVLGYLAFRPLNAPKPGDGTARQSAARQPPATAIPEPQSTAAPTAPEQKTEQSKPEPPPKYEPAPSAPEQKTEQSKPEPPPKYEPAPSAPEQKTGQSTPAPASKSESAPGAPEQKTEQNKRNIPPEKRERATPPTKAAQKFSILKDGTIQISLEQQIPWGSLDVEIATLGGKKLAAPDRFVLCKSSREVRILSGKRNGNAIEPDRTEETALRISYSQIQSARSLKIVLPKQGEIQPKLADIKAFYFFSDKDKKKIIKLKCHELFKGTQAELQQDGQLRLSPIPKGVSQEFRARLENSIFPQKLPVMEWNKLVDQWMFAKKEETREETREKLKELYGSIDKQLKALSPGLAESFRQEIGEPDPDARTPPKKLNPGQMFSFGTKDKQPQDSQ